MRNPLLGCFAAFFFLLNLVRRLKELGILFFFAGVMCTGRMKNEKMVFFFHRYRLGRLTYPTSLNSSQLGPSHLRRKRGANLCDGDGYA